MAASSDQASAWNGRSSTRTDPDWENILDRIAKGETYAAIGVERWQVNGRAGRDPAFRARLRPAIASRKAIRNRKNQFAPGVEVDWERFLKRIETGERMSRVWGTPGMPKAWQVYLRRRSDPEFDRILAATIEGRSGARPTQETIDRVLKGLREGRTLREMKPEMPSRNIIKAIGKRRARDPVFAAEVNHLWNARRLSRNAPRLSRIAEQYRSREQMVARLLQVDVYAAVEAAVPKYLPPFMRDDVKSELIVAVLDGEIELADVAREARRFVTSYNRDFGGWAPSLDADLGDGFTLGNSLVAAYI